MIASTSHQIVSGDLEAKIKNLRVILFDFDGVFTDNYVYVTQEGVESVRCSRSDGLGLDLLPLVNIKPYIVSTEVNPVVSARAKKHKIQAIQAVKDKAVVVKQLAEENQCTPQEMAFVGNDINDIPALRLVGVPVGVCDAYTEIDEY